MAGLAKRVAIVSAVAFSSFGDAPHFNTTRPIHIGPRGTLLEIGSLFAAANPGGDRIRLADYKVTFNSNLIWSRVGV
jgi:hypothetical protein